MSSLAAACADGYYQPETKALRNKLLNKAKKRPDGGLVVRIAVPRNGKCAACNSLVPGGERFNAVKRTIGEHAFRFEFTCKSCRGKLFMSTDPERALFVFEHPLLEMQSYLAERKREEESKAAPPPLPIALLEKERDDKALFRDLLQPADAEQQRARQLRTLMRGERREKKESLEQGRKRGLALPLLPESSDDASSQLFLNPAGRVSAQPRLVLLGGTSPAADRRLIQLHVVKKRRKAATAP